ncbi:MAG: ABC transporter ATP-binding protein [Dehalococcoidia bacterium]
MSRLRSDTLSLSYGSDMPSVVHELSLEIVDGGVTSIIGPNGCGKSTLLRALVRLMKPTGGAVILDGQLIHRLPTREVARRLGLLQQQPLPPEGITVEDLTRRGRYPHQSFLQPPSARDVEAVDRALELTAMTELRRRPVDQLSGGQRQRAWIAMALAQETELLLLDEPTTYLDVAHQIDVLDLVRRLNAEEGRTVVMVLHDVNEAARASDRMVAMIDGRILRVGTPAEIVEPHLLEELYDTGFDVFPDPVAGHPVCIPRDKSDAGPAGEQTDDRIEVQSLRTGYGRTVVIDDLSISLALGAVTAVIGPNACGKSTLLRSIGRLLKPMAGSITVGGQPVYRGSHRAFARRLAMLTQGPVPPAGYVVEDLVAAGRFPHQSLFRQWTTADEDAIEAALDRCELADLRYRAIETLSGGQRQRAWVAMALAQDTPILLLDEPTTFLDLGHQIDLLDLVRALNREHGRTVVMVLHDLNLAARYADVLVAMKDGAVIAAGPPAEVVTEKVVRRVFEIDATIITDPATGAPLVLPRSIERHPVTADALRG